MREQQQGRVLENSNRKPWARIFAATRKIAETGRRTAGRSIHRPAMRRPFPLPLRNGSPRPARVSA